MPRGVWLCSTLGMEFMSAEKSDQFAQWNIDGLFQCQMCSADWIVCDFKSPLRQNSTGKSIQRGNAPWLVPGGPELRLPAGVLLNFYTTWRGCGG